MALTDAVQLTNVEGSFETYGVLASAVIYGGGAVMLSSGYVTPLTTGGIFAGHALETVTGTTTDGEKTCKVKSGKYSLQVAITNTADSLGLPVYMSADGTYTLSGAGTSYVGKLTKFVSTSYAIVEFDPFGFDWFGGHKPTMRVAISAAKTLARIDVGKIIYVQANNRTVTLPRALSGYGKYTIVNDAANGTFTYTSGLIIHAGSATSVDRFFGCGLSTADNKDLQNNTSTTATMTGQRGDFVTVEVDQQGWQITKMRGTWSAKA